MNRSLLHAIARFLAAGSLLAITACAARYPLGIPEEQWKAMSTEQRLQAQEKQAAIDRERARQHAAEARAREAEARAREAELATKRAALDQSRRDARYGERVQCVLNDAYVAVSGKWLDIEPIGLDLVRGQAVPFDIIERRERNPYRDTSNVAFFDGQTVSICPGSDTAGPNAACLRVVRNTADYQRGMVQHVESARFLKGRLRCDLPPGQRR
jgi:hypothetical protein